MDCLRENAARSRAVKLAEVDPLPRSEHEPPLVHKDVTTAPHHRRFDVRITVPFPVPIPRGILGNETTQRQKHVENDVGIGVFVDRNPCRRVRDVNNHRAVANSRAGHQPLHLVGNLDKLLAVLCANFERFHDRRIMSDLLTTGNLVAGVLLVASAIVWVAILESWRRGEDPVAWQPREPCPWRPLAVALALPASIVVRAIVLSSAPSGDPPPIVLLQTQCLSIGLEIVVLMGLLAIGTPIRASDFGLSASGLREEARWGLLGFLAALVPVYGVNFAVQRLGLRAEGAKHSIFLALEKDPSAELLIWVTLTVVVLAPLAEELLYRVVLQGWLENKLTPRAAILFVAILFALVHFDPDEPGRPDHLPLFPLALILGFVYYRRHSYVTVVLLHAIFNATNLAMAVLFGDK